MLINHDNKTMSTTKNSFYFLLICCLILAIGLLGREIYIPSLPHLSKEFAENNWLVPGSLTAFLVGMGGSQLIYGPISDIYGRKKILIFGIFIYLIGNASSCFIESSTQLWASRLFAGIGAGVCTVIPRAMLSDVYHDTLLTKAMAWLAIASTTIPASAPVIGGYLQLHYGWQGPFIFLSTLTMTSFFILLFFVPETKKNSMQGIEVNKQIFSNYLKMIRNVQFLVISIIAALNYAMFIAYAMLSPYFFQETLGFSALENGYLYCFIVLGYLIGSFMAIRLADKFSDNNNILIGLGFCGLGALSLFYFYYFGEVESLSVVLPVTILMVGSGIISPVLTKQSLNYFPEMTGTAAALFGGIRMLLSFVLCLPLSYIDWDEQTLILLTISIFTVVMCLLFSIGYMKARSQEFSSF